MIEHAILAIVIHVVVPGDTLSGIAGARWPAVCQANHIRNCDLIYPGQRISLTGSGGSGDREPDGDSDDIRIAHKTSGGSGSSQYVSGGTLGCSGLERLWIAAGGNPGSAFLAAEIAMAESGGRQYATGPAGERGYWQIHPLHGSLSTYSAFGNARAAIIISGNGSHWGDWTTYTSGAYAGRCLRRG